MNDPGPFTDEDVRRHRVQIDKREAIEVAARQANRMAEHPRNLAEYIGEGDVFDSPPIAPRPAKGSIPFTHNRGLGIPKEEDE
jgi:hypothetical protein